MLVFIQYFVVIAGLGSALTYSILYLYDLVA